MSAASAVLLLCLILPQARALAQAPNGPPLKATLCEIVKQPETFDGKLVEIRALVDSGVDDLPAGLGDESCGASVKFYTPDDQRFARLVKSSGFRKMTKEVKKNPVVLATVTGWFERTGTAEKPAYGLALESVGDVVVVKQRRARRLRSDN
jgi:hypothetical protein